MEDLDLSQESQAALLQYFSSYNTYSEFSSELSHFNEESEKPDLETKAYATETFWEDRYKTDSNTFEWLSNYEEISNILDEWLMNFKKSSRLLVTGCGTSELTQKLSVIGNWSDIVSMDCSPSVIEAMKKKYPSQGVTWDVNDLTHMTYRDGEFSIIIDKATIDALLAADKNSEESEKDDENINHTQNVVKMMKELSRVLQRGGVLIWLSFGENKTNFIQENPWGKNWCLEKSQEIGEAGCMQYTAYLIRKK
ncbi:hypothetical protein EIN_523820 [Entamoeba invadens IP1]|uniref:Methyltransferase domain-containing protein n=1 Tax=Entamoeba invadens IP1 TaxID=370355 RepID=A0A0A1UBJ5_ENTIV|nr:hypothetical protein EIN_523820 [Entamoeba invadens IP1]ELP92484.1 hypothetical protein EIN_523820 [Entamoeba invadens IP1]|eukprot:XP_004259255.1 hypothetical protein EIN_523820 [Entamoeba invadens IP1]